MQLTKLIQAACTSFRGSESLMEAVDYQLYVSAYATLNRGKVVSPEGPLTLLKSQMIHFVDNRLS